MRAAFHLPDGDSRYGATALRNVRNLLEDDTVDGAVAVIANGGGVRHLLSAAPTADAVRRLLDDGIEVCACRNTVERADYGANDLIEGVRLVSSGMAELTRKQDDGYAYIRP